MKVQCPFCNNEWDKKLHATICPRKVAITQSSHINEIFNHINKKTPRGLFAERIFQTISEMAGQEISAKLILSSLGVMKYTDGDLIRSILDYHVCIGKLEKTKYKKGRGGSRWRFVANAVPCTYYSTEKGKHVCSNKIWKKIEEGEEFTGD